MRVWFVCCVLERQCKGVRTSRGEARVRGAGKGVGTAKGVPPPAAAAPPPRWALLSKNNNNNNNSRAEPWTPCTHRHNAQKDSASRF